MDVLVLIDKLDDLIHNARPVPLTDQVRVDREEIYDLLDQMRATIPEEIKQARWIVKERQEMLAEAKREAERVVKEARDQQARLIAEEEVYKQAERGAEEILEDARDTERQIRLTQRFSMLCHRQRFAGQGGFINLQLRGVQKSDVRRHNIARFQLYDIARHQLTGCNNMHNTAAQYPRLRCCQLPQCRHGAFSAVFLHRPDYRVQ